MKLIKIKKNLMEQTDYKTFVVYNREMLIIIIPAKIVIVYIWGYQIRVYSFDRLQ